MKQVIFHLAFPVNDIAQTKDFYANGLGCEVGRESPNSVILNLYGNQIVAHVAKEALEPQKGIYPRHFGLVFTLESDWEALLERAEKNNLKFYQQPKRRFTNSPLEHRTFFLEDPFHNLLEFKYYCHSEAIFGCNEHQKVGDVVAV
ncbi:MAG: glyoxalase [Okeania sp. SIO3B5]|uniref:VOC family protein n=1 Tax=Okeania sp. SIO3B5 TaxID=2607811 RepID=UPI001400F02B|nr:VOC family protein [Okeania sp. SIO3B5]NEO55180.1 glyoxalase [Okeania sp. SIO3B5]